MMITRIIADFQQAQASAERIVGLINEEIDELTNTTISRVMPKPSNKKNLTQYNFDEEL